VFIPIPAVGWDCPQLPNYDDLKVNEYSSSPYLSALGMKGQTLLNFVPHLEGLYVHDDPSFHHFTYGHVKRGFGCEQILRSLEEDDVLLFLATLDYAKVSGVKRNSRINPDWGAYFVGAFTIEGVYETRDLKGSSRLQKRFKENPHLVCDTNTLLWIAGKDDSLGLFPKAVPLSISSNSHECVDLLSDNFVSWTGKSAGTHGWYRHTYRCTRGAKKVMRTIIELSEIEV
jgi:hypothetical protein